MKELAEIIKIESGSHATFQDGNCAMEFVAFMAGEKHSDTPRCASRVIGDFVRPWNDALDDETRQRLAPYLVRIIGTRGTNGQEQERREMVWQWVLRVYVPTWLRAAHLDEHAAAVERKGEKALAAARDAAWAAAWAAAGDAAWDAARDAAWAAAGDAARDAAWDAARDAAWAAAGDAIKPTVVALQESAFDLLDRLIRVTEDEPSTCALPEHVEIIRKAGVPV